MNVQEATEVQHQQLPDAKFLWRTRRARISTIRHAAGCAYQGGWDDELTSRVHVK